MTSLAISWTASEVDLMGLFILRISAVVQIEVQVNVLVESEQRQAVDHVVLGHGH